MTDEHKAADDKTYRDNNIILGISLAIGFWISVIWVANQLIWIVIWTVLLAFGVLFVIQVIERKTKSVRISKVILVMLLCLVVGASFYQSYSEYADKHARLNANHGPYTSYPEDAKIVEKAKSQVQELYKRQHIPQDIKDIRVGW